MNVKEGAVKYYCFHAGFVKFLFVLVSRINISQFLGLVVIVEHFGKDKTVVCI